MRRVIQWIMARFKPPAPPPSIGLMGEVPIEKRIVLKQDFAYMKGDCQLSFSLNIGDLKNVANFRACMAEAMKDLDALLQTRSNKN